MKAIKCMMLLFVAVNLFSEVRGDWSWGGSSDTEKAASVEAPVEVEIKAVSKSEGRNVNNAAPRESFLIPDAILPLEEEHPQTEYLVDEPLQEGLLTEQGRDGRFLGIPNKLCKLGVKGMCENKHQGYPPVGPQTHYGDNVDSSYSNFSPQYIPISPQKHSYPHPKPNVAPPKPFTKLFSDIFKHKKGKGSKGYPQPTYGAPQPTYGAPKPTYGAPKPTYGLPKPTYNVPKPTYNVPKPTYNVPKPSYAPINPHNNYGAPKLPAYPPVNKPYKPPHKGYIQTKPIHHAPKPSYKQPVDIYGAPNVVHHKVHRPKVLVETHVVQPTKVQHVHSHTHIYNSNGGSPINPHDIRGDSFPRDDNNFQATSHIKTTINKFEGTHQFDQVFPKESATSFGDKFQPSQAVPFIDNFQTNTDKRHISQSNGFNKNQFENSQQNFQASIDHLSSSFANNGIQRTYPVDCQCVPRQYCSSSDLVARTDSDLSHLLDARTKASDVLSNATETDEDYYEYESLDAPDNLDETFDILKSFREAKQLNLSEEAVEEEDIATTIAPEEEELTTIAAVEKVRRRRSVVNAEEKSDFSTTTTEATVELQGRQLTGFAPGNNGCGQDHVCCRRPVYVAAKKSAPTCGRGNPSIHGRVSSFEFESGQSDFGEYPWQAAILREEKHESMFVCGATLIDAGHVLTAAHCVKDLRVDSLKVRLGEWDVNRDTEFYKHIEVSVAAIIVHPEFYKGNLYNDIAVIKLSHFIDDSNPHISPVCLPAPGSDFTNHRCHVTGWGKSAFGDKGKFQHILKELEIPIVSHQTCEYALQSTRLGRDYKLHDGFICAGGEEGKDACKGDGGGPLVCATDGKTFQLAGVVSWGIGCGQKDIPGVYVNIPYYVDWINSVTRI